MEKINNDDIKQLNKLAAKRYAKQKIILTKRERDIVYYSILGVYEKKGFDAALNYVLHAKLSIER